MRGKRMIVCRWAAAWGIATAGVVLAVDKPGSRGTRNAASSVDPDGTPIMVLDSPGSTAASAGGCDSVGAFQRVIPDNSNRFRGDVYRVTRNATLLRFEMQLSFTGTSDLYFSIHRAPSGQQFPNYERVLPDVVRRITGVGTAVFHDSGTLIDPITRQPGLRLAAGFDYAIGVTWGDVSVSYGRDQLTYPRPFSQGSVLGLVAQGGPPPLADTVAFPSGVFSGGAYAQQLCFAGACCRSDNTCAEVSLDACTGADQPTEPGVTCDDVAAAGGCPLPRSACCSIGGCLDFNRFFCEASGGVSRAGVLCDDASAPCDPRGGCCLPTGSCVEDITKTRCVLIGGSYRGDGVPCAASPICALGACCSGDSCTPEVSRAQCEAGGGLFGGSGVSCSPNPCAPTGACCVVGLPCQDDVTEVDCGAQSGNYRGDDTTCDTIVPVCGSGACCERGFGCTDGNPAGSGVTGATCAIIGGSFLGDGSTCAKNAAGCAGSCCRMATQCNDLFEPQACDQLGGSFAGYAACFTDPCSTLPATGTCCLPDGGCTRTTIALCRTTLNGTFKGVSNTCSTVDCTPTVPTGACCTDAPAACTDGVAKADCSGRWTQDAICGDVPSPCERRGACCDRVDANAPTCTDNELETNCQGALQTFTADTACANLFPPCEPIGACCDVNVFQCLDDVVKAACDGAGRTWSQDTTCDQLSPACVAPAGACCTTVGQQSVCSDGPRADCLSLGGVYHGDGTTCATETCGACCNLTGLCEDNGLASGCAQPSEFHAGLLCVNVCVAGGSCCLPGSATCSERFESQCSAAGGLFGGSGTDCVPNPCLSVVSTDPPDCAVDARQPFNVDGSSVSGSDRLDITFDGSAAGLTATDFLVESFPGLALPPNIADVLPGGDANTVTIVFDAMMFTQEWTCVTHISSGRRTCVGFLPADVDGSLLVEPAVVDNTDPKNPQFSYADLTAIAACADSGAACGDWSCDADRSGSCTPADMLRVIDLINGAGSLGLWLGGAIDACPNTTP